MYNEQFNASLAKGVVSFEQRGPVVNLGHSPLQGLRLKVLLHETVLKNLGYKLIQVGRKEPYYLIVI